MVERLPYIRRLALLTQASDPDRAKTMSAKMGEGVRYARGVLKAAHGDRSACAAMPSVGEGARWLRETNWCREAIQQADPEWWIWFKRAGEPKANLETGGASWDGALRGDPSGEPPPAQANRSAPPASENPPAPAGPIHLATAYPRVQRLLRSHLVHWMIVRDRMADLLPLYDQDIATSKALAAQLERLGQMAAEPKASRAWFMDRENVMLLLAALAGGYGVGRLALGTVKTALEYAGGEEGALELAERTDELVERLVFSEVVGCSQEPTALAAAVHSVSAEEAAAELEDPIGRLRIHAARRGFLVAIAQEALTRGAGEPDAPAAPALSPEETEALLARLDEELGMEAEFAEDWLDLGLRTFEEIEAWEEVAIIAQQADLWIGAGYTLEDLKPWIESDAATSPNDAFEYVSAGLSVETVLAAQAENKNETADADDDLDSEIAALKDGFDSIGDPEAPSTPAQILESHPVELLAAYGEARATNTPLDALFAAMAEVVPDEHAEEVRSFALGELDDVYGAGAGYRATAPLLVGFDVLSGYSLEAGERARSWQAMGIVDLAEAIATDPLLTDSFLWAMHHNVDDDAASLTATATAAIIANSRGARTQTGRKIKVDQALKVLHLLEKKAHESGPEHQEMWCRTIANLVTKHAG